MACETKSFLLGIILFLHAFFHQGIHLINFGLSALYAVCCQVQQPESTCQALEELLSNRNEDRAGNCSLNMQCTQFVCVTVNEDSTPPVVATSTYTFFPCQDPIRFAANATVPSQSGLMLVFEADINRSTTVEFIPPLPGSINFTLVPLEDTRGVTFGVSALGSDPL